MQRISNMFRGLMMPAPANRSAGSRSLWGIGIVGIGLLSLFLILVGCAENGSGIRYVCTNGTAAAGTASADGIQNCASCNSGYIRTNNNRCVASGSCINGAISVGTTIQCRLTSNVRYTLSSAANRVYFINHSGGTLSVDGTDDTSIGDRLASCPASDATLDSVVICPANQRIMALAASGTYTLKLTKGDSTPDVNLTVTAAPSVPALFPLNVAVDPTHDLWYYFYSPSSTQLKFTGTATSGKATNRTNGSLSMTVAGYTLDNLNSGWGSVNIVNNDILSDNSAFRTPNKNFSGTTTASVKVIKIEDGGFPNTKSKRHTFRLHN